MLSKMQWQHSAMEVKNKICNYQSLGESNSTFKLNGLFAYEENHM